MSTDTRSTVSLFDLARNLPGVTELPGMLRNAGHMLVRPGDRASIGLYFQRRAAAHPDRPFLRFEGREYTWGETNSEVNRYAHVLAARGVGRGDVVGILLTNRPEALFTVLAVVKLGAAAGLLNHNQRDAVLQHSFGLLNSVVDVVGEECADALGTLTDARPNVLWSAGLSVEACTADASNPAVCEQITAGERAYLVFTSGTTGLPKASVMTHLRWTKSMAGIGGLGVRLRGSDTLYCCLPLYHNNALTVALSSVMAGGATFALSRKFSASRFWKEVVASRATAFVYIGELCRYLLDQPPGRTDREHTVRLCVGNGLRPEIWDEFQQRFGPERIVEFYGASEGNVAFINAFSLSRTAGFTPLPFAVVEYDDATGKALRDPDGLLRRVRPGGTGLLLAKVTDRSPFDGYTDAAATESKLVRDGFEAGDCWFDTGDLVRNQRFGHIAFVDRLGDTFRWKGENVATTEVEGAFEGIESITQAVAFGVDIPGAEGKAGMAAVTLREGATFDGRHAAGILYDRLPNYAVPLFIRIVAELEQTSTFKTRKVELRKQGYTPGDESALYVLAGRAEGYVPAYPDYADQVVAGQAPRN
ncbi:long-chain-acyl-CoA synthetase [Nocardia xishanensis]|uniref:long-chain-acyl-CoA synthetase n=1 Tax=Nocardia xishanensis TaxID=238964 RepID=UPI0033C4CE93